jgi:hypothetical protein
MKKSHATVSDVHTYWQQYQDFISAKRDESPGEAAFHSFAGCRLPYSMNKVKVIIQLHVFLVPMESVETDFFLMKTFFMTGITIPDVVSLLSSTQNAQEASHPFHPRQDEMVLAAVNAFVDIWNSRFQS